MPNESIYELTNQLARVRITRQRALRQIALSSGEEAVLLVRIDQERAARANNAATAANDSDDNNDNNDSNNTT